MCHKKKKIKFENYKKCLEATQREIKINYPEKDNVVTDSIINLMMNSIKNNDNNIRITARI